MDDKSDKKHQLMTQTPAARLILRLAVPSTLSMLLTSVYGFADAKFISDLGNGASGAVGIVFSVSSLIQTIGFSLGTGAGSLLSRALGERDNEKASGYAAISFWLALLLGGVVSLAGLCFTNPIIRFLGANESIFPFAKSYAFYLFCAAPVLCVTYVLNILLRSEGKVIYSMVGLAAGNLLNILLDPLLIFRFGMGCAGASLATLISQSVGAVILLSAYVFQKGMVSLRPNFGLAYIGSTWLILVAGLPSLFRQGLAAVASVLLTRAAGHWGTPAVAAFSVCSRIFLLLYSFCLGIGQGMMPAVGYNKGAGDAKRVRKLYRFAMLLATGVMLTLSVPTGIFAPRLIAFFRPDAEVIAIGTVILRAQCSVMALHGVIAVTNMLLQAVGRQFAAALVAGARQGIFFLPLIFRLPAMSGLSGLQWVQPLADVLTFLLTLPFAVQIFCGSRHALGRPSVQSAQKERLKSGNAG